MNIQIDEVMMSEGGLFDEKKRGSALDGEEPVLPKVSLLGQRMKKDKKYDIRGRIEMKNGKLNLSRLNNDLN